MKRLLVMATLLASQVSVAGTFSYPALKGQIFNNSTANISGMEIQVQVNCRTYGMFNSKDCGSMSIKSALNANGEFSLPATNYESSPSRLALDTIYSMSVTLASKTGLQTVYSANLKNTKDTGSVYSRLGQISLLDMPEKIVQAKSTVSCRGNSMVYTLNLSANGQDVISQEIMGIGSYASATSADAVNFNLANLGHGVIGLIGGKISKSDKLSFNVLLQQAGKTLHQDAFVANSLNEGWDRATKGWVVTPACN